MTQRLKTAIEALEKLPEEEQERYADKIIDDLDVRGGIAGEGASASEKSEDDEEIKQYGSFRFLSRAKLEGRSDESVTYERDLYGREADLDG